MAQTGTGVERRAFGEFVGSRGELASYAFGWTTNSEHHHARLTVGIGAGNPGGASFHAIIFDRENSYACSLVDEPFERVPEGGPDLTATEARAHEDLPFIWWVVDLVMERDRRARWMKHWLLGTSSIQTGEVFDQKSRSCTSATTPTTDSGNSSARATPTPRRASSATFTTPWNTTSRCSTFSTSVPARAPTEPGRTRPGPPGRPETGGRA
ncbi:hypothetical protein ACTFTM_18385 [Micromonospora sp. RB23]